MIAYIESIGLQAPGLEGWQNSLPILQGQTPYESLPLSKYSPQFLPANERRRTTPTIKLALRTAQETVQNYSTEDIASMPTLFCCVDGDTEVSAKMTHATLQDDPMISPIHFHNSVHNAPAGYWMIGQGNQQAASAISAGQYQIGNSLVEAMTQLDETHSKVLLVVYDLPIDPIIESFQPDIQSFGFGLILTVQKTEKSIAQLNLSLNPGRASSPQNNWCGDNIAAQFLPALKTIARQQNDTFEYPISEALYATLSISTL
ncbi:beta-ketoacyl synthase chain length factor [Hydrogenovibrio sp. 3SP14C1]|uniref:beta-ketoacyl synthase chain length factor n=1 Tax=Hydrogenovibrio sp. 3SP14C1 TaxID=3038774 RepID=UPI002416136F|nr:beta-ketoacyl synthase chain length factor [Hydrogenovibrio sp. 3SP14C1]MDG4811607.1 beta-ketoacyl synthase chain length factor [Hydrogenovibrio sp. 3SP14C1]